MPATPQGLQAYTTEEIEEERAKIWSIHVEFGVQYENKLRDSIMYPIGRIGWLAFYEQLSKLMDIWNELKNNEATLKPIVKKRNIRDNYVTILCCSVISLSCEQIKKTFDMTNGLSNLDNKRIVLQRRIINYFSKYLSESFEIFPYLIEAVDKLKNKEEWAKELDDLICIKLNKVINENDHI